MKSIILTIACCWVYLSMVNGQSSFYALTPMLTLDSKVPVVDLFSPCCGEEFIFSDSLLIDWLATDDTFDDTPISLGFLFEHSNGLKWFMNDIENSGQLLIDMIKAPSKNLKMFVKAIDSFGNLTVAENDSTFSIDFDYPFIENFEDYSPGSKLVTQADSMRNYFWRTWSYGNDLQDGLITDNLSLSGNHSLDISVGNDVILLLGGKTEGNFVIEFSVYVKNRCYFNIMRSFYNNGVLEFGPEVYFLNNGNGMVRIFSGNEINFEYAPNSWIAFTAVINLDENHAIIYLDNEKIVDFQWDLRSETNQGIKMLDVVDFWGGTTASSYSFNVDDIRFDQFNCESMEVFAGYDTLINNETSIDLNGHAKYYDSIFWTTSGDGYFENLSSLLTNYTFGNDDLTNGSCKLILNAVPISPCTGVLSDTLMVYIQSDQLIVIPSGWSGTSSYVNPFSKNVESLFSPILSNLIILQSENGMYWPGENVNTIGNWSTHEGYKIKVANAVELTITGSRETNKTLQLSSGWNLIPVLSECAVDVEALFTGKDLVIVKEVAGWNLYWPAMGINTLGGLQPGKAYFVLMGSAGEIEFPECDGKNNVVVPTLTGFDPARAGLSGLTPWPLSPPTASNHAVALPLSVAGELLHAGDIIGVFDQDGNCSGLGIWQGDNTVITIFGNDPTTSAKDGFTEGESLEFRLYRPDSNEEFTLEIVFDKSLPNPDPFFATNGLSAISEIKMSATGIGITEDQGQIQIIPNPARDEFLLVLPAKEFAAARLELYRTDGQFIQTKTLNEKETRVDISNLPTGVYILKVEIDGQRFTKRLVKY